LRRTQYEKGDLSSQPKKLSLRKNTRSEHRSTSMWRSSAGKPSPVRWPTWRRPITQGAS